MTDQQPPSDTDHIGTGPIRRYADWHPQPTEENES